MAETYNLTIEQGSTFTFTMTFTGLNLTGYSARMQGRLSHASSSTVFSLTSPSGGLVIVAGTDSTVTATISAATTAALTAWSAGSWDIELVSGGGVVTRQIQGTYIVTGEVTK